MADIEETSGGWRKSTRSSQGNCVEVHIGGTVKIRDTKDQEGPMLLVSREAWQAFRDGVRNGEFDLD